MDENPVKVLLIEDNPGDRRLLWEMLHEASPRGFAMAHVGRLADAMAHMEGEGADVILTDLGLPDSKGYQTFETLHEAMPDMPIVVLTGEGNMDVGVRSVKEGAQDFLVKGQVDGNLLVRSLRYAIERNNTRIELKDLHRELERRARDALYLEKERLAVTLGSIVDAVIATDIEGSIVLFNKVAQELTGCSEADAIGRGLREVFRVIHQGSREACEFSMQMVVTTRGTFNLSDDATLLSAEGEEYQVAGSCSPILDRAGDVIGVVLVFRDVTEMKKWEDERARLETIRSLGLLAGGIAHDFNNILTGILGNVNLARAIADGEGEIHEHLDEAEKALDKARRLVQQLMTVSRGGEIRKEAASLTEIVEESTSVALSGSSVTYLFDAPDGLWPVEADITQIGQVVQNLVLNAVQAMPDGGELKLKAANVEIVGDEVPPLAPGRYVRLTVADKGVGIEPEFLEKVFDPYFTTKQKGSGLGLAVVFSAITRHGGHVDVESEIGKGTTFNVYLPASEREPDARHEEDEGVQAGTGRVLVLDDEPFIRDVCKRMLEHIGYEAETVETGDKAVERYLEARDSGRPFDLLILDLTVPGGLGGREVLDILLEKDPGVKAIASSGYSRDPVDRDCEGIGFAGTLDKPYTMEKLGQSVRSVLHG